MSSLLSLKCPGMLFRDSSSENLASTHFQYGQFFNRGHSGNPSILGFLVLHSKYSCCNYPIPLSEPFPQSPIQQVHIWLKKYSYFYPHSMEMASSHGGLLAFHFLRASGQPLAVIHFSINEGKKNSFYIS